MTSIPADNNSVRAGFGVLQSDGKTPAAIQGDPLTHVTQTSDGSTGTDQSGRSNAVRDANSRTTLMAVSSTDGATPVILYIDGSGNLLVKST